MVIRPSIAIGMLFLSATMLLCACSGKKPAKSRQDPPEVKVVTVAPRDVPIIQEWVGVLDGSVNARIQARVSGYIISQNYKEGDLVRKGDLLFEIDPRPFLVALDQAKADLAKAEADQTRAGLTYERDRVLVAQKVISQDEFDASVQANAAAKALVVAQKAAVERAEIDLGYTKVIAPITGIAGIANVNIGDLAGSNTLTTVSTVDPIKAYISLIEREYLVVARRFKGIESISVAGRQPVVEMALSDGTIFPHKGRVDFAGRQIDEGTGTIRIAILFPNPGSILRPGQFARIRIPVDTRKGALLVPQQAVNELQGTYQIAVVNPTNKAEIRTVQVGDRIGGMWVINSGLKPGERVVAEGIQKVHNNTTVVASPWTPPASLTNSAQTTTTSAGGPPNPKNNSW